MLARLFGVLLLGAFGVSSFADDFHRRLAEHHAPVIVHELGKDARADVFTRFDFDGDELADNNWENAKKYPLKPAVYFEVIESETHYFITYAYFHPRDYTNFWFCLPIICHENDLEGAIVTVKKNGISFGKAIFVEALAHSSIAGRQNFRTYAGRAILQIESGGHGIYLWNGRLPKAFAFYSLKEDPTNGITRPPTGFELLEMKQLWNLQARGKRTILDYFEFKGRFKLKRLAASFAGKKYGTGQAQFPWGWKEFGGSRGEWFLDPALWVHRRLKSPAGFSLNYIHHPYLSEETELASLRSGI
jgi:hypothetical protein